MNKKIPIGCIIAVVILVLVSFTGVVGYQTTQSSTIVRASPLFTVRSSRAIDEESNDFTCDFVGKGEDNFLSIPKRDGRIALVQKFIDRISKMDDETFNRLIQFIRENSNYPIIPEKVNSDNYDSFEPTTYEWFCLSTYEFNLCFRFKEIMEDILDFLYMIVSLIFSLFTFACSCNTYHRTCLLLN